MERGLFFFFQAEDGIRDVAVTGVQTCALPISLELGEVVFLPGASGDSPTLAERERQAILDTLEVTHGKLAETARRLGISRTTLWRRLRAYGLRPDGNGGSGAATRV